MGGRRQGLTAMVLDVVVCVVDDDAAAREGLSVLLGAEGMQVREYASAEAFLADAAHCACVISDIHMPGKSGLDLLRELGRRPGAPPVILVTGRPSPELRNEALLLGAVELVQKPLAADHITTLVWRAVRRG